MLFLMLLANVLLNTFVNIIVDTTLEHTAFCSPSAFVRPLITIEYFFFFCIISSGRSLGIII